MTSFATFNFNSTEEVSNPENVPPRTGDIRKVMIHDKLKELGLSVDDINLGAFDEIGEYTAKKRRDPSSELYKKVGAFFRPNYERGILIYSLIRKYNVKSFLEIGFGRGYGTMCAAYALSENGGGKITTIDPNFDQRHLQFLTNVFPKQWFEMISFINARSQDHLTKIDEKFDMIYIDGDHTYDATKADWELCKDRYNKLLLFDDYHLPGKVQKDIDCSNVIDYIDDPSKHLIIQDRRIFFDDRKIKDEDVDYGQVLLVKDNINVV